MEYALHAPLLASLLLAAGAPLVARRCPPRAAALVLVACAAGAALSTLVVLVLHAVLLLARLPAVAAAGGYDPLVLRLHVPVPAEVSVAAVGLLGVVVLRAVLLHRRRGAALRAADALCARLGGSAGGVVVVDDGADAFALASGGGRVVVSRDLLGALHAHEAEALLAHERAHLRGHHDLLRAAAAWAVALDPLLGGLERAVRYASERWADEDAAAAVGDRPLVARALARAGLARRALSGARPWRELALAGGDADVVPRVRAMLGRPPRRGAPLAAVGAVCLLLVLAAGAHAVEDTAEVLEHVSRGGAPTERGWAALELTHAVGERALDAITPTARDGHGAPAHR